MPFTTYGLLAATRSHQITSPSVSSSLETGRPNACNQCHLDQTLSWAATQLEGWYGIARPELTGDEAVIAASLLWILQGDAGQRALMAWTLGWDSAHEAAGSDWTAEALSHLLVDPYDAVRFMAFRSLRQLPEFSDVAYDYNASAESHQALAEQIRNGAKSGDLQGPGRAIERPAIHLSADVIKRLVSQRDNRGLILAE
jgi:hypothetical protein